jgi:biopolymer transport protein TolR
MAFSSKQNGDDDSDDAFAEINIIPLVDVMLVLLIIFMVTAPLSIGGIKVELPFSKARGGSVDENRVVLSINRKGEYYLEKMNIPLSGLDERMRAIYQYRERKELYIRADLGVEYGKVVSAMSAAKMAGVSKISMLTQPPNQASKR